MSARKIVAVRSLSILCTAGLILVAISIFGGHLPHKIVQIGQKKYDLEYATTPQARATGLSGRKEMAADHGMLFVYDKPEKTCMWMKDMGFALDIIWLDYDSRVIHIKTFVSPNTYPADFCPPTLAGYVIELKAGQVKRAKVTLGQHLSF